MTKSSSKKTGHAALSANKKNTKGEKSSTAAASSSSATNKMTPHVPELFMLIAPFISDATTLCRCAAVCRGFYQLVMHDRESLWEALAARRWHVCPIATQPMSMLSYAAAMQKAKGDDSTKATKNMAMMEYKQRYQLDQYVANTIHKLAEPLVSPNDLKSNLWYFYGWGNSQESKQKLNILLMNGFLIHDQCTFGCPCCGETHDRTTGMLLAATPLQIVDSLRPFLELPKPILGASASLSTESIDRLKQTQRCMAWHLADNMYFMHTYQEWKRMVESERQLLGLAPHQVIGRNGAHASNNFDVAILLAGVCGIAQVLLNDTELSTMLVGRTTVAHEIDSRLQAYSSQLQAAIELRGGRSSMTTEGVVDTLLELMYDTWGFSGHEEDFFNPANSSVYSVLETKKGNQPSLVAIAILILQGVNVQAHAAGLPGHVILGVRVAPDEQEPYQGRANSRRVPTRELYFDVYNCVRGPVQTDYFRRFVSENGDSWRDSFLVPMLPALEVLRIMVVSLKSALEKRARTQMIRDFILSNRIDMLSKLHHCPLAQWEEDDDGAMATGMTALSLDQDVFASHGLLDMGTL